MGWQSLSWPCSLVRPPRVVDLSIHNVDHAPGVEVEYTMKVWSLNLYRYAAGQVVDGVPVPISPGHAGITPPGLPLSYRFSGPSTHASVHFMVPVPKRGPRVRLPVMQRLGSQFDPIYRDVERAIACFSSVPSRAQAIVWNLLWRLSRPWEHGGDRPNDDVPDRKPDMHPAVREVLAFIELNLGRPLAPADVAKHTYVSRNHLNSLFVSTFGESINGYVIRRRVEHARHLLVNTTMPIDVIAVEVGIPELRSFDKTVREALGKSPSEVRGGRKA